MSLFKRRVLMVGLGLLGIAMITTGTVGRMLPPILTGVGFLLIAWAHAGGGASNGSDQG